MSVKTVIIYSSVDGQTKKICHVLKDILVSEGHLVDQFQIQDVTKSITIYDKIVIASSIRYGKHNEHILSFIQDNNQVLNNKKTAFISVNLVARKTEKSTAGTNPYVIKFFNSITWKPQLTGVFAGRLNNKLYSFRDRLMIKLIMLITKGPVSSKTDIEYTDWNEVSKFGHKLCKM
ncbi:menaquinone-dependent protoporphyrinogen IX dehydrogenase [Sphingobacterium spiritivorum]|uniref:menaquinone-dependent protoporphyrinogen IX dehydrogenase n=1 Tax=Sphingobacterium spiritivorum TaxID=258 RepID=UPI0036B2CF13